MCHSLPPDPSKFTWRNTAKIAGTIAGTAITLGALYAGYQHFATASRVASALPDEEFCQSADSALSAHSVPKSLSSTHTEPSLPSLADSPLSGDIEISKDLSEAGRCISENGSRFLAMFATDVSNEYTEGVQQATLCLKCGLRVSVSDFVCTNR